MMSPLFELLEAECATVWIRLLGNRRPKHWCDIDDPMVTLKRNLLGRPLAGLLTFSYKSCNTILTANALTRAVTKWNRACGEKVGDNALRIFDNLPCRKQSQ